MESQGNMTQNELQQQENNDGDSNITGSSNNGDGATTPRIADKRMRPEDKPAGATVAVPPAMGLPSEVAVLIMNKLSLPHLVNVLKVFKTWAQALPSYSPELPPAPWLWLSGALRQFRPRYFTSVVDHSTIKHDLPLAARGMRCLSTADGMMLTSYPGRRVTLLNPVFPEHNPRTLPPLPWEPDHLSRVALSARGPGACMVLAIHREEVRLWAEWREPQHWEDLSALFPRRLTHAVAFLQTFVALDVDGAAWFVDPHIGHNRVGRLPLPEFRPPGRKWDRKGYLVECGEEVLLAWPDKQYGMVREMDVFGLDLRRRRWTRRCGLGDAALFLSTRGSVALPRAAEARCRGNSIYYVPYPRGPTWKVYSMADGSVTDSIRSRLCPAYTGDRAWIVPRLPWPAEGQNW